jgi:hypothetical protein
MQRNKILIEYFIHKESFLLYELKEGSRVEGAILGQRLSPLRLLKTKILKLVLSGNN